MSFMADVREKVRELGSATVDDLLPFFPGWTRPQVAKALNRCALRRWIVSSGPRRIPGQGVRTTLPPIYRWCSSPTPQLRPLPPSSAWDLGSERLGRWPPVFRGGREFKLLGSWVDAEDLASNDSRKAA